ncbi:zinc finger MYM-type protein 1-like [Myzus persicae]|uniref:zinc finger MYM-type protein 1-like n=1 Tax=Myzus persicae TaxID=13164 RepID=UPI000B93170E|nr:zinc finger MYM-type protein 1-like [Myzus persicae]
MIKSNPDNPDDPANLLPISQLERKDRVVRGPFQPKLKLYPRTKFGDRFRCFNKSWYELFNWLEYSVKLDRAFCFPCRMFTNSSGINAGHTESTYSKVGFNNWKLATTKFKAHQTSNTHLNSITSLTNFLHLKPIDTVLDEEREHIHSQKEQQRLKNRQIMQRLIDITLCIGIGGRSFRGKNEKETSYNKGLFKDIVTLLAKYDPLLKSHLELGPKNATYCSNIIQNDLIISISQVLKNQLKHKIENKKISIIADETSDLGHHEQLSIVLSNCNKMYREG